MSSDGPVESKKPAEMEVERGAESWQFFAFIYAAILTLLFALIDEVPDTVPCATGYRILLKILAFMGTGYFTLINARCRNWLVGILHRFKKERHSR